MEAPAGTPAARPRMSVRAAQCTVLVRDYDEAIAFFVGAVGLPLAEDSDLGGGKRWVALGGGGLRIILARATDDAQRARVGDQTGGRVGFFLETDDFAADYKRMCDAGVEFVREPKTEPYGTVAVFRDLYGNLWDLIGR